MAEKREDSMTVIVGTFLLAGVFVFLGVMKFTNADLAERFYLWGYHPWFRYLIGAIEIGCGVMLVVRRVSWLGAALLAVVLIGAIATHIKHDPSPFGAAIPALFLVSIVALAWHRYPRRRTAA